MQHQIDMLGPGGLELRPTFAAVSDHMIIGTASWVEPGGRRETRYPVLTIRNGKIADMQVCGSWRQAKRFARRRG